jgi:hypothetical protein
MLHDHFCLGRIALSSATKAVPRNQSVKKDETTRAGPQKAPEEWKWALHALLNEVDHFAKDRYRCSPRGPEYRKVITASLEELSRLAGFIDVYRGTFCQPSPFAPKFSPKSMHQNSMSDIIFLFTVRE